MNIGKPLGTFLARCAARILNEPETNAWDVGLNDQSPPTVCLLVVKCGDDFEVRGVLDTGLTESFCGPELLPLMFDAVRALSRRDFEQELAK